MQDQGKMDSFIISEAESQLLKERDSYQELKVAKKEATRQAAVSSISKIWLSS